MTVWATGSGTNPHSVGINLWLTNGTYVNWELRVKATWPVSENQNGTLWGAATWSGTYRKEGPGEVIIASGGFWGTRGQSYGFGGRINGIYGNNDNVPDVFDSIVVPVTNPETPSAPSISLVGTTTARAQTNSPNGNGAAIDRWAFQRSLNPEFTSGVQRDEWEGNIRDLTGFAPNTLYYMRAAVRNASGLWSGWSEASTFRTNPEGPNAPSNLLASWVSDGAQNLTWSNNATTGRPYSSVTVQRRSSADGVWRTIANLGATVQSMQDTSTSANQRYDYQVRANNAAGSSDWTRHGNGASDVSTTPAAPSSVTATKDASNNIVVAWTANNPYADQWLIYEVQDNPGFTGWVTVATGLATNARQWTHSAPSQTVTHTYRVRAVAVTPAGMVGAGPLGGPYAVSGSVQLAAPPNPPTITGPVGTQEAASPLTLTWLHNPVDSSPQQQRQVRYRLQGAATWTTGAVVASSVQSLAFAADTWSNGQVVEFQALTFGQHDSPSSWSPTFTVTFSAAPTTAVNAPLAEVQTPTVTAEWGYYQANGSPQVAYEVELWNSQGVVVERRAGPGAGTAQPLQTVLGDSTSWTVRVRALSAAGRWSGWAAQPFSVAYPLPETPTVGLLWDQLTASVSVTVENPEEGVPVVANDLYRQIDDGPWERIAVGVPTNATVIDRECAVAGTNAYYATAWTELPSASSSEPVSISQPFDHERGKGSVWISGGDSYEIVCHARYSVAIDDGLNRERVINRYEGRTFGSEVSSQEILHTAQVAWTVLPKDLMAEGDAAWDDWLVLAAMRGPHLWRDKAGRRFYGTILGDGPRLRRNDDGTYRGQIALEETEKP